MVAEAIIKLDKLMSVVSKISISSQTDENVSLLPQFPLDDVKELEDLENDILQKDGFTKQLVSYNFANAYHKQTILIIFILQTKFIASFGVGTDDAKAAGRLFPRMISNDLSNKYSWAGTATKRSFKNLENLLAVIFNVIAKEIPHYTKLRYEKSVKTWLRHAEERIKKSNNKSLLA